MLLWLLACAPETSAAPPVAPIVPSAAVPQVEEARPPEPAGPVPLVVPTDAAEIARRLVYAEAQIVDPAVSDAVAAEWGHAQQRIFRALWTDPVRGAEALALVSDPALAVAFGLAVAGSREIAATVTRPRSDLPDWRILAPDPVADLEAAYRASGAEHGVPWTVLAAIHLNETKLGRLRGVSPSGAQGPMQFMPPTWAAYGRGDVNDTQDAIWGAGHYVAKSGWARDPRKAIWHYNQSEHYVTAILDFAKLLDDDPRRLRGWWGWQVYYRTVRGPIWLSEGYASTQRMTIDAWCAGRDTIHCPAP